MKNGVELKLFERKLEFWNLFENWSLKNYLKTRVLKIKFKKLNLKEIEILKFIWQLEFWKLNLRIKILEIKFWKLSKDGI